MKFENKFKKIFSGHFHTRSKKDINGTDIIYVGSPYQLTRADFNEERGSLTLDLDTLEYTYINNTK